MVSNEFNPGQVFTGYVDPNHLRPEILLMATEILNLNLNTLQSIIPVSGKDFFTFGHDGRAFMAFSISRILMKPVIWAKDGMGTNSDRWFLGPISNFVSGPHMIASINGTAVVVPRPSHQSLGNTAASGSGARYSESPEPVCKIKVPRPPNAYILYRKDHHARVKQTNTQLSNNEISKILGKAWNHESPAVRQRYTELAKMHKERLLMLYPDYRYTPRKPSEKRRRRPTEKAKKLCRAEPAVSPVPQV
ncbi:HMG box protein [Colletotrichum karsti]|uniref:HMG box protein n=1 Tax=Colletotrichum karsti TaxID=1095194 RepID=A0A9P6LGH5_9PEZI|nr:mating type protein mat1-2-1 [Colletotrichum karsti]KAF9872191.1 HMG box protein [Colletotrichum karsti]